MENNTFDAIGIMSGSSLDGLDIAYCRFRKKNNWRFDIICSETIPYPENWLLLLKESPSLQPENLVELDFNYGKYIGTQINNFVHKHNIKPSLVASHGHTVFHNPSKGYTLQIGNGQAIAHICGIKTICDFRSGDVILGGQGAPLVPIGDELLFCEYDYCINLGGIANISYNENNIRLAFDISPANQLLNYLSNQVGEHYDKNGAIASLGKMNSDLFKKLNDHDYYSRNLPKSMSNQLVTNTFIPIIDTCSASVPDKLYTVCKHIAYQISKTMNPRWNKVLITGGGAHNSFLVKAIELETNKNIIIPSEEIIDYKEALIFAFMGVLRSLNLVNVYASVTGASADSSQGVVYNKI